MNKLIWDDENAPGISDCSPEELKEISKKVAAELILMLEFENALSLGQVH